MANDMHCFRDDHELAREILRARTAAHTKHGDNSIESLPADHNAWLRILMEEVGEAASAMTYDGCAVGDLRAELIDVAAVVTAWIDALDRQAA